MNRISTSREELEVPKKRFSVHIDKILFLCINFVICSNILVLARPDIHPVTEPFFGINIQGYLTIPPFNLTSRPLQYLSLYFLGFFSSKVTDVFFLVTVIFAPFVIYTFKKILETYKFNESTKNILLILFSILGPFQSYLLGFNTDFLFLTFFLASIYYLKLEKTNLFIIYSILAVLSKEVAVILVILNFFIHLDKENYFFNRTNFKNILIALPIVVFLGITRIFMNPVTFATILGIQNMTLGYPNLAIPSSICFLGIIWFIPIFVWKKIERFDKIFLGILFGVYLPLTIVLGSIWELKLMLPYAIVFIPSIGYWLEDKEH